MHLYDIWLASAEICIKRIYNLSKSREKYFVEFFRNFLFKRCKLLKSKIAFTIPLIKTKALIILIQKIRKYFRVSPNNQSIIVYYKWIPYYSVKNRTNKKYASFKFKTKESNDNIIISFEGTMCNCKVCLCDRCAHEKT